MTAVGRESDVTIMEDIKSWAFSGFGHLSHKCMELLISMLRFCLLKLLRAHDLCHSCYVPTKNFYVNLFHSFFAHFKFSFNPGEKPHSHKQAGNNI